MNDSLPLFDTAGAFETFPLPVADIRLMPAFYRKPLSEHYLDRLHDEIGWRQETIVLWGKEYAQPRLSAWYGDPGRRYAYSGVVLTPLPWTATLLSIKDDIERACGHRFNSVLLNLYRDEHDSVGWHSDAEPELGKSPVIASLSLGAARTFKLRHRARKELKPVSLQLQDGSLLLMAGTTQRFWQHAVPKERVACDRRINLTFRSILTPD